MLDLSLSLSLSFSSHSLFVCLRFKLHLKKCLIFFCSAASITIITSSSTSLIASYFLFASKISSNWTTTASSPELEHIPIRTDTLHYTTLHTKQVLEVFDTLLIGTIMGNSANHHNGVNPLSPLPISFGLRKKSKNNKNVAYAWK